MTETVKVGDKEPSIDNWTFRLFYRYSSALLILGSFIVSSNQFFGEPIQCDLVNYIYSCIFAFLIIFSRQPGGGVSEGTLKTYCWMYSSFNIPAAYEGKCARKRQSEDVMYNSYYQWVSLCLVGQVMTHPANRNFSVCNQLRDCDHWKERFLPS